MIEICEQFLKLHHKPFGLLFINFQLSFRQYGSKWSVQRNSSNTTKWKGTKKTKT